MRSRLKMERQKTVTEPIEEIKNDICNNYCKWPDVWDEEAEGCDLSESDHCRECPFNRL